MKEIFVDGIDKIHFAGGMVRLDLGTLQPTESDKPEMDDTVRLILPPQGFLNTFQSMQQLINKLAEAGVIQRAQPNDQK